MGGSDGWEGVVCQYGAVAMVNWGLNDGDKEGPLDPSY